MPRQNYFVYILSNSALNFYIGFTGNLDQRIFEHHTNQTQKSFVTRYNLDRLIFVETYPTATAGIAREKQLKGWSRAKKLSLIRQQNPEFKNLLINYGIQSPHLPGADPSTGSG